MRLFRVHKKKQTTRRKAKSHTKKTKARKTRKTRKTMKSKLSRKKRGGQGDADLTPTAMSPAKF